MLVLGIRRSGLDGQRFLLAGAVGTRLDLHCLRAADLKGLDRECFARLASRDRDATHGRLGHAGVAVLAL